MTSDKVNLCGCPCSAQDPFRCPSFMTLWECHLYEKEAWAIPMQQTCKVSDGR